MCIAILIFFFLNFFIISFSFFLSSSSSIIALLLSMHKKVNSISFRQSILNKFGISSNFGINVYPINMRKYTYEGVYISFWLQNELRKWKFLPLKLEITHSTNGFLTMRLLIFNKIYYKLFQFLLTFKHFFSVTFFKKSIFVKFRKLNRLLKRNRRFKLKYKKFGRYRWGITVKLIRALSNKKWFTIFGEFIEQIKKYHVIYKSFFIILRSIYRLVFLLCSDSNYNYYFFNCLLFLVNFARLNSLLKKVKKTKFSFKKSRNKFLLKKKSFLPYSLTFFKRAPRWYLKFLLKKNYKFLNIFNVAKLTKFTESKKLNVNLVKKLKKKRLLLSKRLHFKKWCKHSIKFTFFYCRNMLHQLFCIRLVRVKSYIEKYGYEIFKKPVIVQVFIMNNGIVLNKGLKNKYSNIFLRKNNLLKEIGEYAADFNIFNLLIKKKFFFIARNDYFYDSKKNLFYSVFALKKSCPLLSSNIFNSIKFIPNYYLNKDLCDIVNIYPLFKNLNFSNYVDKHFKKHFSLMSLNNNRILNTKNEKFEFFVYLLYSYNRNSFKYLLSNLVHRAVKSLWVTFSDSEESGVEDSAEIRKAALAKKIEEIQQIRIMAREVYSVTFFNYYLAVTYFKGILEVLKKTIDLYSNVNIMEEAQLKKNLIEKEIAFLIHNNSLKTLNLLSLIHINPARYLKITDYFTRRRLTRVSIEKHNNLKKNLKLMFFSLYFGNASLFNEAFCKSFKKLRKHKKFLVFYEKKLIEMFYNVGLKTDIAGIHMRIRGKIDGKTRRSTYWIRFGKSIKEQTIFRKINYNFRPVTTFTGVFGVSTWFVYVKYANVNSRENKI